MNGQGWKTGLGLSCALALAGCSGGETASAAKTMEPPQTEGVSAPVPQPEASPAIAASAVSNPECPGFEGLFAMLPEQLAGEAVSDYYVSCDAVSPMAQAHFTSLDEGTYWTFSVTTRDPDSAPARPSWDLPGADEAQKARLRKGVESAINAEALLFDICLNNLQVQGLPDWHRTARQTADAHEVCVGTDAQAIEDGGWVGRAVTPQYVYTLKVEGDRAITLGNVESATPYMVSLFRQFRPART